MLIRPILDKIIQCYGHVQYIQYDDFYGLEEIGSGGYGTVYTAKYKKYIYPEKYNINMPETVVLKQFKNEMPELFISEVSNL